MLLLRPVVQDLHSHSSGFALVWREPIPIQKAMGSTVEAPQGSNLFLADSGWLARWRSRLPLQEWKTDQ
jgi:hypothetical protein